MKNSPRAGMIYRLANKGARELFSGDLLNTERRRELIQNGLRDVKAIFGRIPTNIDQLQPSIGSTLEVDIGIDGVSLFHSSANSLHIAVFKSVVDISFYHHLRHDAKTLKKSKAKYYVKGVTTDNSPDGYPNQGFMDNRGIVVPFIPRNKLEQIQHGGLFFDNGKKIMEIVDYRELQQFQKRSLNGNQVLLEANWYMDSRNQSQVALRSNLLQKRNYNFIGYVTFADKAPILITGNNHFASINTLRENFGIQKLADTNISAMTEIAATMNVVTAGLRGDGWAICGLEFNGGGTYPKSEKQFFFSSNHFQINF